MSFGSLNFRWFKKGHVRNFRIMRGSRICAVTVATAAAVVIVAAPAAITVAVVVAAITLDAAGNAVGGGGGVELMGLALSCA
jgi:hypothetical protein